MGKIVRAIRHNLANAHRFDGREPKGRYWRFALPVLILYTLGSLAIAMPFVIALGRGLWHLIQNPPKPGAPPPDEAAMMQQMVPNLDALTAQMTNLGIALFVLTFLLLAAATVRRLHDRGRTGWWVVLPVPFYLAGFLFAPSASEAVAPELSTRLMLLTVNGYVAMGALIWVIVQAASDGTRGDNRYGPEPA